MKKTVCFAAFSAGALLVGTGIASAQEAPAAPDQAPTHPHTVTAGESLSKIAQAELGTSDRWVEIFAVNQDVLSNPNLIEVGQVLDVPSAPVAVPEDLLANTAPAPRSANATPARRSTSSSAANANSSSSRRSATRTQAARPTSRTSGGGAGGNLGAIRACESGGNYGAVSANGRYRGAYQFDRQTWASVGGSGDPAAASPAEQDARAARLQSQRGSNPWPNCS